MVEVWFLSKVEHQVRNHNVIAKKTRGFLNICTDQYLDSEKYYDFVQYLEKRENIEHRSPQMAY